MNKPKFTLWLAPGLRGLLLFTMLAFTPFAQSANPPDPQAVEQLINSTSPGINALRAFGADVLPVLARLYEAGDETRRATIANVFYQLGWKSPEAEQVLMRDVHTNNSNLRISVQYALGRVSDSPAVVDVLLDNMMHDGNALFRDKAACSLAYDQIHLNEKQKFALYKGLIQGLESDNLQVRQISLQALQIQTGQDKGYNPRASDSDRTSKIKEWQQWLEDYRNTL